MSLSKFQLSTGGLMQRIDWTKTSAFCCFLLILSLFAGYQVFQTTTFGAGLSPDSVNYLSGARNILEDGSLKGLSSHWPPLYSILIALSGLTTSDHFVALRWLQIVTLVANLICFTCIIWKASQKAIIPTLVGGLLFVTAPSVLYIHTMAWSEGAFCLFALLGFYFLSRYLEEENSLALLTLSSLFIGLGFITRYVGVSLILTGMVTLFFLAKNDRKKRIYTSLFYGFSCSLSMLFWIGRNWLINETTSRTFVFHPVPMERMQQGVQVLLNWLHIPADYPFLLLVVLGVIAAQYSIKVKESTIAHPDRIPEICFIFVCTYIIFLLFSISFFDSHTPLDERILIPVYIFCNLGLLLLIQRPSRKWTKEFRYIVLVLLIFLVFAQHKTQKRFIDHAKKDGLGFASKEWVESDTLQWLEKLPKGAIIYTNASDPIKIYTNHVSKMLPNHTFTGSLLRNENIIRDINVMASEISGTNGVIVYFNAITWRWYLPTLDQLNQVLPLQLVYKGKDGMVVRISEAPKNAY